MLDKNIELVHDLTSNNQYIAEHACNNPGLELVLIK